MIKIFLHRKQNVTPITLVSQEKLINNRAHLNHSIDIKPFDYNEC